jgi:hypothetical protein
LECSSSPKFQLAAVHFPIIWHSAALLLLESDETAEDQTAIRPQNIIVSLILTLRENRDIFFTHPKARPYDPQILNILNICKSSSYDTQISNILLQNICRQQIFLISTQIFEIFALRFGIFVFDKYSNANQNAAFVMCPSTTDLLNLATATTTSATIIIIMSTTDWRHPLTSCCISR